MLSTAMGQVFSRRRSCRAFFQHKLAEQDFGLGFLGFRVFGFRVFQDIGPFLNLASGIMHDVMGCFEGGNSNTKTLW